MHSITAKLAYATSPEIEDGTVHQRDFSPKDGNSSDPTVWSWLKGAEAGVPVELPAEIN